MVDSRVDAKLVGPVLKLKQSRTLFDGGNASRKVHSLLN